MHKPVSGLVVIVDEFDTIIKQIYIGHCADVATFRAFAKECRTLDRSPSPIEIWKIAEALLGTRRQVVIVDEHTIHIWENNTHQHVSDIDGAHVLYIFRSLFNNQYNEVNPLWDWGYQSHKETVKIHGRSPR